MGNYQIENNFCILNFTNELFFTILNWLELFFLILLTYAIKDIKDELSIRDELVVIALTWFFFSLFYSLGRYYASDNMTSS